MKRLMHSVSHLTFSPSHPVSCVKTLVSHGLYSKALKASADHLDLHLTDQIYSLFIKSGFVLDIYLGSFLIDRFSEIGNLKHAHCFLLDMSATDIVVWNALISGYARTQQSDVAFRQFDKLRCSGLRPDVFTLSSLIKACSILEEIEVSHMLAVKMGFSSSSFIISGLVDKYSKASDMVSAKKCFEETLVLDTVIWTTMVSGCLWNEELEMAQEIFIKMRVLGVSLNQFSLTSALGAICDVKDGEMLHGLSIKMGFVAGASVHLSNAIMSMYCNCGVKTSGVKMFDEILDPDIVSWTARIGAAYDAEEAFELLRFLNLNGLGLNEYIITNVLSMIDSSWLLKPGKQIQALCFKTGYVAATAAGNALISMYGKCKLFEEARRVFDEMHHKDCVSWNALIDVYAKNRLVSSTLAMLSLMRHSLFEPTKYTLASVLDVFSSSDVLELAKQVHAFIIKLGFASNDTMLTSLITTYGKCGKIENSKKIFSEISNVALVHVNAVISTLVHGGYHVEALEFFYETWTSKLDVDGITFSIVLKACGVLATLEQTKSLHAIALKFGTYPDNFFESAIVDVYCKCGSITDAVKAFEVIKKDNLAAWNAMIMGYAQHGLSHEVFKLFNQLPKFRMNPDQITYLGVLNACCHEGLAKEAYTYLTSMFDYHGLVPQLEHYGCMVDLLGRIGDLDGAKGIIDQMLIEGDAQIWQSLLSACNIHANIELGKFVAQKLLDLRPKNDSAYVLLSNLYASAGMWDEVGNLRKVMKDNVVTKEPGSSWIQVKGIVHSFFANDQVHPESGEIYSKLRELTKQMIGASALQRDANGFE